MLEIQLNFKLMFHSLDWNQAKVLLKDLQNPMSFLHSYWQLDLNNQAKEASEILTFASLWRRE